MSRILKYTILNIIFLTSFVTMVAQGPFSPAAGEKGSDAIHKDSELFTGWAVGCEVFRGYVNISKPELGYASAGSCLDVLGKAGEKGVLSLGDGGHVILTFNPPISNGPGFDFAVFENAFDDYFLELAFVEVSSDGENFFRFPSISLTQTDEQVGTFGILDPTYIHNLAGKYRIFYGTPFDLDELKNESGLDVNKITHVKIIDVIGSLLDEYVTYDSMGNKINSPWPTPFPSGGFDLDGVGVINSYETEKQEFSLRVMPNPIDSNKNAYLRIFAPSISEGIIRIFNLKGLLKWEKKTEFTFPGLHFIELETSYFISGFYIVTLEHPEGLSSFKILISTKH